MKIQKLTSTLHFNQKFFLRVFNHFAEVTCQVNQEHRYKIKASHAHTFKVIGALYYDQLKHLSRYGGLNALAESYPDELPLFRTFNASLKKSVDILSSPVTVHNHRQRLRDCGAIIEEFRAGGDGLRMALNPLFFCEIADSMEEQKMLVDKYVERLKKLREAGDPHPAKNALNAVWATKNVTIEAGTISYMSKDNNKHVDNLQKWVPGTISQLVDSIRCPASAGRVVRPEQEAGTSESSKPPANAGEPEAVRKLHAQKKPEQNSAPRPGGAPPAGAGAAFVMSLIVQFWEFAQKKLYADCHFSPMHRRQILNLLFLNLFNFRKYHLSEQQWRDMFCQYVERIEIAAQYFEKRPHMVMPSPEYYFSPPSPNPEANEMKFARTHEFLMRRYAIAEMNRIQFEVVQRRKGEGRYKDKNMLELSEIHKKRMLACNSPTIMRKFKQLIPKLYFNLSGTPSPRKTRTNDCQRKNERPRPNQA